MSALLVAAALLCWPTRPMRVLGRRTRVRRWNRWSVAGVHAPAIAALVGAAAAMTGMLAGSLAAGLAVLLLGSTTALVVRDIRRSRRSRRSRRAAGQLLRTLSRELAAGASLSAALMTATDAPDAAGRALADRMRAMAHLGRPPPSRQADACDDVGNAVSSAVGLARRHGVAIAGLISRLADSVAEDLDAAEQKAAGLAGARLSGILLAALPLLGIGLGAGIGANPVPVLLGGGVGGVLLVVGTALCCAGVLWSSRIAR